MYWILTTGNHDDNPRDCVSWVTDGTEDDAIASLLDYNTITAEEDPDGEWVPTDLEELVESGIWWTLTEVTHVMVRHPDGTFHSEARTGS